jgi:hypothetical protein
LLKAIYAPSDVRKCGIENRKNAELFRKRGFPMARTPKGTPPSYPKKPHRGQARITVRLIDGKRHDLLLGPFGSPESRATYRRVLTELDANSGYYPQKSDGSAASRLTVHEICLQFWRYRNACGGVADRHALSCPLHRTVCLHVGRLQQSPQSRLNRSQAVALTQQPPNPRHRLVVAATNAVRSKGNSSPRR